MEQDIPIIDKAIEKWENVVKEGQKAYLLYGPSMNSSARIDAQRTTRLLERVVEDLHIIKESL